MRKIVSTVLSIALIGSASIALPNAALAQSAGTVLDRCKVLVDLGRFDSVGECVGNGRSNPVKFCRTLDNLGVLSLFGFENRGDCVSTRRRGAR